MIQVVQFIKQTEGGGVMGKDIILSTRNFVK